MQSPLINKRRRPSEIPSRGVFKVDFSTIDWIKDANKERERQLRLACLPGLKGAFSRSRDWFLEGFLVVAVGIACGVAAAFIDVSEMFLSDFREGVCSGNFFLSKSFCCWGITGNQVCTDWWTWDLIAGGAGSAGPFTFLTLVGSVFDFLWWTGTAVLFASVSAILVKEIAPFAAGSGIPEVKTVLGGFTITGFLGWETLAVKCLGLAAAVGSGLTLGKEGPLVHVACCIAYCLLPIFEKYRDNQGNRRELLSAACAAGVSCAFGAPIGGVLFSLEEVSYYFPSKTMWKAFIMAMVAAISLQVMNPFRTGKLVLFQVLVKRTWYGFELPFFILLGVLGGVLGAMFIKLNLKVAKYRRTSWWVAHPIMEVAAIALATAVISSPFHFLRSGMAELVVNLFRECSEVEKDFHGLCASDSLIITVTSLLFAAIMKFVFTVFTFGIKVPSGIFLPPLAVGALLGRAVGMCVQAWHQAYPTLWVFSACQAETECVTPGTYAIVGAAAALAGVTRMTVSLVVIIFELTGALSYVLPVMIVILIAKWVGDSLEPEGIYDALIHLNGYPFLSTDFQPTNDRASDIMTPIAELSIIPTFPHQTRESLERLLQETDVKGYPVVISETLETLGYISRTDLVTALEDAPYHVPVLFQEYIFDFAGGGDGEPSPSSFNENVGLGVGKRSGGGGSGGGPSSGSPQSPSFDISPWLDKTPFMVHPKFRLEVVVELFKKMGLRYLLVTRNGALLGIITKKDLIQHA